MTAPSRRAQNRQATEARILSAAMRVFSEQGYSGATMDAIAAQAGVTKPTLYQYFGSKDALFSAMLAAPRDAMMLSLDLSNTAGHVEDLLRFARLYAATVMQPDLLSLARLVIGEAHRFPDVARAYQQAGPDVILRHLMGFMEDARAAGHLVFEDAELAAQDFWGLILSAPRTTALHRPDALPGEAEIERYVLNGVRVFLRAYAADPVWDLRHLERISGQPHAARPPPG